MNSEEEREDNGCLAIGALILILLIFFLSAVAAPMMDNAIFLK